MTSRDHPSGTVRLAHQPAIDGIRAVAVIAVVLYHAGVSWMSGGFLGVDAFFVVSGFLITSLLIAEHGATGSIDLRRFWVRRLQRLVPALLLLLIAVACWFNLFARPETARSVRGDSISALLYVSNWRFIFDDQSYFDLFDAPSPLRHTWSLAIEEQWYVIWPIVILVFMSWVAGRARRRSSGLATTDWTVSIALRTGPTRRDLDVLAALCATLAVGSAGVMALLSGTDGDVSRAYYGTDTRAQALLVGAAIAFAGWGRLHAVAMPDRSTSRRCRVLAAVGAVSLALCAAAFVFVVDLDRWLYRGGFLVIALAWAAVVAAATNGVFGPVRWLLGAAPLVALGRISYGIYLWHWPIQLAVTRDRFGWSSTSLIVLRLALTVGAATLSFVLVEQPVRRVFAAAPEHRRWRPRTIGTAAVTGVVAVVLFTVPSTTAPAAQPVEFETGEPPPPPSQQPVEPATGTEPPPAPSQQPVEPATGTEPPPAPQSVDAPRPAPRDLVTRTPSFPIENAGTATSSTSAAPDRPDADEAANEPIGVVTVGDSVGFNMGYFGGDVDGLDIHNRAVLGCGIMPHELWVGNRRIPRPDDCDEWLQRWSTVGTTDIALVFLGAWEVFDVHVDGERMTVGSPAWNDRLEDHLQQGVEAIASTGTHVALMSVPCLPGNGMLGEIPSTEREDPARVAAVNRVIERVAETNAETVSLIDWAGFACPDGQPLALHGDIPLRPDGVHTDADTTPVAWTWIEREIRASHVVAGSRP